MSKRKPVPDRERKVCERLKLARENLRFTQQEFANEVGIKRERLASYEDVRAPVRFDIALRICHHFFISEKWLATGQGNARMVADLLSEPEASRVPFDAVFGDAYDKYLGAAYDRISAGDKGMPRPVPRPDDNENYYRNLFALLLNRWFAILPPVERSKLMIDLAFVGDEAMQYWERMGNLPDIILNISPEDWQKYYEVGKHPKKRQLTEPETHITKGEVKPVLPNLLARLRKATQEPGKKSELARFLDAPLASVSRWLSPDPKVAREPGGEVALKMLHWVEAQERK